MVKVVVAYLLCAVVWSTTWISIRATIGPGRYPIFASAAIRFVLAAAILGALWLLGVARPGPRNRRQLAWLALAGVLNASSYSLVYSAEQWIPGGLAALLYGTMPLFTALIAIGTRTERVGAATLVGSLLALCGIAVLFWDRLDVSSAQALGIGLVITAVLLSAAWSVIFKRNAGDQHLLAATGVFLATTALVLCAAALVHGKPVPWPPPARPALVILYLAVFGSIVTFASYFYLLRHVRLMTATTLVFIEPVLALAIDAVWETGVRLGPRSYAGAAIVLVGIVCSIFLRPARSAVASAVAPPAPPS